MNGCVDSRARRRPARGRGGGAAGAGGPAAAVAVVLLAVAGCSEDVTIDIVDLDDQDARVGETFHLEIVVRNPSGVDLSFSFTSDLSDSGAAIYPMDDIGIFRWTPLASHKGSWTFTFRAEGGGASDTESIVIHVLSDIGPVFIQPGAGGTYDLSRDPCVGVHVLVKDEDSLPAEISITEREPRIEGATLTAAGKEADWRWCPSPAQVDATDRYTLGLAARDESHDPVHHDYVIVLRGAGRTDCPGGPPEIVSTAPPPPDLVATSLDYRIDAVIRDDRGLKERPILYYTDEAPPDPARPDVTTFAQTLFVEDGGDRFHAFVPNLGLSERQRRTVYYVVSAVDNDDAEGSACDHRVDAPLRSFDVTPGGGETAEYCEPCSTDAQCASGACVAGVERFCAGDCAACTPPAECREVTTTGGRVSIRCVPPGLACTAPAACTDDVLEENDSWSAAAAITPGVYSDLRICPADEDYYRITLPSSGTIDVLVDGWDASTTDIDLQLLRADGTPMMTSAGIDRSEEITTCGDAGTYGVRVWGFMRDAGPYDLLVLVTPGSCCADDGFEDNDSYAAATPIPAPRTPVSGQVCAGDDDWFRVTAGAGRRLSAELLITGGGDLDLELYDTDGMRRLAASAGIDIIESVAADVRATGTYYLRVYGYRGAEGTYDIEYAVGAGSGCASSLTCPRGMICDGATCIDDACTPGASTCPAGTFCPETGGAGGPSDCVDPCTETAECRSGYACKIFAAGSGCAQAGAGIVGAACGSFRDCAGERVCLAWPGGYCARQGCTSNSECGPNAWCVRIDGATLGTCVKDCLWDDADCRLAERYACVCARDTGNVMEWVCLPPGSRGPAC